MDFLLGPMIQKLINATRGTRQPEITKGNICQFVKIKTVNVNKWFCVRGWGHVFVILNSLVFENQTKTNTLTLKNFCFREELICFDTISMKMVCGNVVFAFPISHPLLFIYLCTKSIPVQETQLPDFKNSQDGLFSWTNGSEANDRNPPTRDCKR